MNTGTKVFLAFTAAIVAAMIVFNAVSAASETIVPPVIPPVIPPPVIPPVIPPVQTGKLAIIYYGWHTADIDQQILSANPKILIDNTPGGYWHANCNPQTFQSQGVNVFSYIFSNYDKQSVASNRVLIDAITAEGTYGVFIDECNPTATGPLSSLCSYAHAKGLKVIVNPGVIPQDNSLYQIADFVVTDEQYTGRAPSAVESGHLLQTIVVGFNSSLTVQQAVAYTQAAWAFGFGYAWQEQVEYVTLPTWLSQYVSSLGKYFGLVE